MNDRRDDAAHVQNTTSRHFLSKFLRNLQNKIGIGNSTAATGFSQLSIPPIQLTNKNVYISIQIVINKQNINVKKIKCHSIISDWCWLSYLLNFQIRVNRRKSCISNFWGYPNAVKNIFGQNVQNLIMHQLPMQTKQSASELYSLLNYHEISKIP